MPELPEVETIRRQLSEYLPLKIRSVEYSPVVGSILKEREFSPRNKTLLSIDRKGKMLIFNLNDDLHFISHLGMSGGWIISEQKITINHTHFQLSGIGKGSRTLYLAYVDPRRFGNLYFLKRVNAQKRIDALGVDVATKEFTKKYLEQLIERFPNKILKPFLLDQKYFAGIGNYLASEICAHAGILPFRQLSSLNRADATQLIKATKKSLNFALKAQGTTFAGGYRDASGERGEGVKNLVVFYQDCCRLCNKNRVVKTQLGGRGTYHCPKCQQ
ncbi:MAG: Fpg/Nei family DNA glycosylase [Bdellovibrionales bacterium]|jgi:formamidopyrimidine-DNA glycosylase|nr:Fpg/Nei family DNA glycosylase [Bdellovibrionales bacterium]MBT3524768.1 Fpg/Nei family DNA glycosylase [Bdellovibrionales bacterium]MBT7669272.1 Fpg/Nei family DNA glycosylase [Bdellovibrionales bacterium]MBT7766093.1 Fpg/Nei family DNA glycosylase [Bdellovibrionales bacterium]